MISEKRYVSFFFVFFFVLRLIFCFEIDYMLLATCILVYIYRTVIETPFSLITSPLEHSFYT